MIALEEYELDNSLRLHELDKLFWDKDREFEYRLRNYIIENIEKIFKEKFGLEF